MTQTLNEINSAENSNWEQHIKLDEPNIEQPAFTDNAEEKIPDTPEQVRTKLTFSQAGLPTIILVGSACLGGTFLALMLFKGTIGGVDWSAGGAKAKTAAKQQQVQPTDAKDQEISRLKAQLMIGQTAQRIKAAEKTKPSPTAVAKSTSTPSPSSAPVVRPVTTTATTPIQPRPRMATTWKPVAKTASTSSPIAPKKVAAIQKPPAERVLIAANIGSFGSVESAIRTTSEFDDTNTDTDTANNYQSTADQSNDLIAKEETEISGGIGNAENQTTTTNYPDGESLAQSNFNTRAASQIEHQDNFNDQAVNYSVTTPQLVVGTKASGKLETGVAWSGSLTNTTQSFRIQLREPLLAADNTVVIPKGAYLVARVDSAGDSGLIEMSVVSVLLKQNGRIIEKPLPELAVQHRAIRILGKGGNYLQAKATRRNNARNDVGMVLLSGISRVASLSNQLDYQSTYSDGDFTSTTSRRDPNYLAGLGQGAATELLRQQRARGEQVQQSIESQPNVFVLKQGTTVQVYVNQSLAFE